jgi:hypothetical protein
VRPPEYEPPQKIKPHNRRAAVEWAITIIGGLVIGLIALFFFSCRLRGQDIYLPTMTLPDTNSPERTLLKRPAQPPVPALPPPAPPVKVAQFTNEGKVFELRIREEPPPPALVQDKPKTNAFWVMCPHCSVRAIRRPLRMETNGVVSVPDGDTIERTIHFRCCKQEFKARNFKFVELPIAEEVTVPVK